MEHLPLSLARLQFSDQGNLVIGLSRNPSNQIHIWSTENQRLLSTITIPPSLDEISFCRFYENMNELIVGTFCGHLLVYDVEGTLLRRSHFFPESNTQISDVAYCIDLDCGFIVGNQVDFTNIGFENDRYISKACSFDWETFEKNTPFPVNPNSDVGKVFILDQGKSLVTCPTSYGIEIYFWDLSKKKQLMKISPNRDVKFTLIDISNIEKNAQLVKGRGTSVKVKDLIFDEKNKRLILGLVQGLSIWDLLGEYPSEILGSDLSKGTSSTRLRNDKTIVVIQKDILTEYMDDLNDFDLFTKAYESILRGGGSAEEKITSFLNTHKNRTKFYGSILFHRTYDFDGNLLTESEIIRKDLTEYIYGAKRVPGQYPPDFCADLSPNGTELAMFDDGCLHIIEL